MPTAPSSAFTVLSNVAFAVATASASVISAFATFDNAANLTTPPFTIVPLLFFSVIFSIFVPSGAFVVLNLTISGDASLTNEIGNSKELSYTIPLAVRSKIGEIPVRYLAICE